MDATQPQTPDTPATEGAPAIGKRQPCPCGSGKKFKNCHFDDPAFEIAADAAPQPAAAKPIPGTRGPQAHKAFPQGPKTHQAGRPNAALHRRRV